MVGRMWRIGSSHPVHFAFVSRGSLEFCGTRRHRLVVMINGNAILFLFLPEKMAASFDLLLLMRGADVLILCPKAIALPLDGEANKNSVERSFYRPRPLLFFPSASLRFIRVLIRRGKHGVGGW